MVTVLIDNWWALALRGLVAVLFGIIAILSPTMTATVLVLLFAAYALIDGAFALVSALRFARRSGRLSSPLVLEAILDILLAGIAFLFPGAALVVLVYVIAFWALLSGFVLLAAGFALLRADGDLLLLAGGFLSVLLGIILLIHPGTGVVALAWWLGLYALLFGTALLVAAFRLRYRPN